MSVGMKQKLDFKDFIPQRKTDYFGRTYGSLNTSGDGGIV